MSRVIGVPGTASVKDLWKMNMEGGTEASPSKSEPSMAMYNCSGEPFMMIGGGTWRGHVIPGAFFLLWGLWWGISYHLPVPEQPDERPAFHWQSVVPQLCALGFSSGALLEDVWTACGHTY